MFWDYFSNWQDGLTVSSIICDSWWHLKILALTCHRGWACLKIEVEIVRLVTLRKPGGSILHGVIWELAWPMWNGRMLACGLASSRLLRCCCPCARPLAWSAVGSPGKAARCRMRGFKSHTWHPESVVRPITSLHKTHTIFAQHWSGYTPSWCRSPAHERRKKTERRVSYVVVR